jgi:hypothetical protein
MKMLAVSILIYLTLGAALAFTHAPYDSCSCAAEDGTCSLSITCRGGCMAWCPSDGCVAGCLDGADGSGRGMIMSKPVTLRLKGSNGREVSDALARVTGEDFVFSPSTVDATLNLDVENLPVWNVLEILSQSGRIQISGIDFYNIKTVRRTLLFGERLSVCAHGMTVKRFVNELRFMTGLDIQTTSGDPNTIVSYTGKWVNLNEVMTQVSERTGVQITVK